MDIWRIVTDAELLIVMILPQVTVLVLADAAQQFCCGADQPCPVYRNTTTAATTVLLTAAAGGRGCECSCVRICI